MAPPVARKRKKAAASQKTPAKNAAKHPRKAEKQLKMRKGGVEVDKARREQERQSVFSMMIPSTYNESPVQQQQQQVGSTTTISREQAQVQSICNPLEMLSDDLLGNVFFSGYVNSIDIVKSITMVSKRTKQVAHKSVKMLDLRKLPNLQANDVAAIVSRHGNLSSLDFGYCPQFGREHLLALVPVSETLRTLCLRGTNVQEDDVVAFLDAVMEHLGGKPCGLEELDLSCIKKEETSRIGDAAVSKIAHCCPELKSLHLGWCKGVTNKCLPDLKNLRRLKDLDLSLTSITQDGCRNLANVFELEKLDLSATGIGNEGIRDLLAQDPKRLVRLKLQDLKLSFNSNMTDESLSLLTTHMPSLKTLDIRYCEIEKNDFKEIFRQLTRNGTKVEGGG